MNEVNKTECLCCGAIRDYPTEEGHWEFFQCGFWTQVEVKRDEEGLTITPYGEDEPIWWPNNVRWRKI